MDEYSNFRYIWNKWIVPLINDLYTQTDEIFREKCNLKIRDLDDICNEAEVYYQHNEWR